MAPRPEVEEILTARERAETCMVIINYTRWLRPTVDDRSISRIVMSLQHDEDQLNNGRFAIDTVHERIRTHLYSSDPQLGDFYSRYIKARIEEDKSIKEVQDEMKEELARLFGATEGIIPMERALLRDLRKDEQVRKAFDNFKVPPPINGSVNFGEISRIIHSGTIYNRLAENLEL